MNQYSQHFLQKLTDYAATYSTISADDFAEQLSPLFAEDVFFKDPFNQVKGVPAVLLIFKHMFNTLDHAQFDISHSAINGNVGYIHWTFQFAFKDEIDLKSFEGLSQIRFNSQGLVTEHIDYWDAGEVVYSKVPVLGWLVRFVAKKLSVKE